MVGHCTKGRGVAPLTQRDSGLLCALTSLSYVHTVGGRAPEDSFPKQPRCESPGHTESMEGKSTL